MQRFVDTNQKFPDIRSASQRKKDYNEIQQDFKDKAAEVQASRCAGCGVPFCQSGCPLGNDIPDWLALAAEGELQAAYEVSSSTSTMPEICGRICPQDRLCEAACVIEQSGHGSVTIGAVEQFITDNAWQEGWVKPVIPGRSNGLSAGIIGSGPAGLSAAEKLREAGWSVTVYDRYDRVGGLLIYGIPNFKIEKDIVERRVDRLRESGIEFQTDIDIGKSLSFESLRSRHDAVLIATGVYKPRVLDCPSTREPLPALEFLIQSNRAGLGDDIPDLGHRHAKGKCVVVIGGGDTAMDCVRTAIRQGAKCVTCLYRRDKDNMPGSRKEAKNAEEEGIRFQFLTLPETLTDDGLTALSVRLQQISPSERGKLDIIEGSRFSIKADMVVTALGFEPEPLPALFKCPDLKVTSRGTLDVDPITGMTSIPGVFAAGDIVRGASLVVWAIRDGMQVAKTMTAWAHTLTAAEMA